MVGPRQWRRILKSIEVLDFGKLRSLLYGIVQTAKLVNKLYLQGIAANPHTSLCYLLHTLNRQFTSVSHTLAEQSIASVDVSLQHGSLLSIKRTSHYVAECSVAVGLYLIKLHTELLCHKTAHIRNSCKDAYATRKGVRLSHYP